MRPIHHASIKALIISASLLSAGTAFADLVADRTKELAELELERKISEERNKINKASVEADYAKEKALKEIFGTSPGREGAITVGESKTGVLMRAQTAGADAVKELALRMCSSIKENPFLVTEAQLTSIREAKTFEQSLKKAYKDLEGILPGPIDSPPKSRQWSVPLAMVPVLVNAFVAVEKLFRQDYAIVHGTNDSFNAFFDDLLATMPECKGALPRPNVEAVRNATDDQTSELVKRYKDAESLLEKADLYLNNNKNNDEEKIAPVKSAVAKLSAFQGEIKPGMPSTKLGTYASALGLASSLGVAPRLTYKVETQLLQVLVTRTWLGTKMERSASAQTFYRILDHEGELLSTHYLSYSTPHTEVALGEEEWHPIHAERKK